MDVITYTYWDKRYSVLVKEAPGIFDSSVKYAWPVASATDPCGMELGGFR